MTGTSPTILVVGDARDIQTKHQIQMIEKFGAHVVTVGPYALQGNAAWNWPLDGAPTLNGQPVPEVDGVLVRALPPEFPTQEVFRREPDKKLDWEGWFHESCLQRDRFDTFFGLLLALDASGVPMCNRPSRSILSRRKPYQLQVLKRAGCPLPETLVTNVPEEARLFLKTHHEAIVKPAGGGALTLSLRDLDDERLDEIRYAPAIVQRRVFGKDLRVMVLDGTVISCAAIEVPDDTLDFRGVDEYSAGRASYTNVELPPEILEACARATKALGLTFSGIDIKHTPDDHFIFLECNSSPIYLDVELKLGHPITESMVRRLVEKARDSARP